MYRRAGNRVTIRKPYIKWNEILISHKRAEDLVFWSNNKRIERIIQFNKNYIFFASINKMSLKSKRMIIGFTFIAQLLHRVKSYGKKFSMHWTLTYAWALISIFLLSTETAKRVSFSQFFSFLSSPSPVFSFVVEMVTICTLFIILKNRSEG